MQSISLNWNAYVTSGRKRLNCLISDIRAERHKNFWGKMTNMLINCTECQLKSLDIPQLDTESCWNSDLKHLLGIPLWGFEKIFHVSCSLLHLPKVQRLIAWGSLHFYFVILYFWPFPSQKATSYVQQNVVRCLPSTQDRVDRLWHLLSLLSLLLSVISPIGNTTHQVSSTDSL